MEEILPGLFLRYLRRDKLYIELFCEQTGFSLQDITPDWEDFPPPGLMYFCSDNLGGYSLNGIKATLSEKQLDRKNYKPTLDE